MPDLDLPSAMVNAAAEAEYRTDMAREESDDFEPIEWDAALPFVRDAYLNRARAGLGAGLALCEVAEQFRVHWIAASGDPDDDSFSGEYPTRERAEQHIATFRSRGHAADTAVVERLLQIYTPVDAG